jgi:signal transduction histidine kinase
MSAVNDQVDKKEVQEQVKLFDDKVQHDIDLEYDTFRRMDFNFPLSLLLSALLAVAFITRGSIANLWWLRPAAPFYLGFFLGGVSVVAGYIAVFSRLTTRSYIRGITPLEIMHDWAMSLTASRHGHIVENANILCFTAAFALYMFGRCLVGQCPEGVSMWDKQSCNPSAAINSVPLDLYALTMFAPLIPQLLLKGANRWAIMLSWVICAGFFNASHVVVGAPLDAYAWINIHFVLLIGLSYEFERGLLCRFLAYKERDDVNDKRVDAIEQLETNRRTMMEAEAEKKRAMVRYIGHEIRNPLNTIQGSLEVLQIELKPFRTMLHEDIFEIISTCRESCSLGKEIVSDLVAFEQIAAGKYTLELSHTSILNYVYESIRPFNVSARAKRVNVVLQTLNCAEATMVNIDVMKMGQVMRNLLSNAVKFSKKGGEVAVKVTEEASMVTVAVTDQGPGLTTEQIGQLFQEGVQFDTNKHQYRWVVAVV